MPSPEPGRRVVTVRMPDDAFDALRAMADAAGRSMNTVLVNLIQETTASGAPLVDPSTRIDLTVGIACDAARRGPEAVGALIGSGRYLYGRGQQRTAALIWLTAARLIEGDPDPERGGSIRASDELARIARDMKKASEYELAIVIARQAVEVNPRNRRIASELGQWLFLWGRRESARGDTTSARANYEEAVALLREVRSFDSYARLFHGLAAFEVALADENQVARVQAVEDIRDAMQSWAYSKCGDPTERSSWIRQARWICSRGERQLADELVVVANDLSASIPRGWKPIRPEELDESDPRADNGADGLD